MLSGARFCSGDCIMVGIVYLVVEVLGRRVSVSFCLIVNASQAELDCQYKFPMISFLTNFNLM